MKGTRYLAVTRITHSFAKGASALAAILWSLTGSPVQAAHHHHSHEAHSSSSSHKSHHHHADADAEPKHKGKHHHHASSEDSDTPRHKHKMSAHERRLEARREKLAEKNSSKRHRHLSAHERRLAAHEARLAEEQAKHHKHHHGDGSRSASAHERRLEAHNRRLAAIEARRRLHEANHQANVSAHQRKVAIQNKAIWSGNVVQAARAFEGTRYRFGGTSRSGFDCSGFTRYILGNTTGVEIPRTAVEQYYRGAPVERDDLQAGDLVFFRNTYKPGISHVGIYIGDGRFVHAANSHKGVVVENLDTPYYMDHFAGARRVTERSRIEQSEGYLPPPPAEDYDNEDHPTDNN